MQLGEPPDSVVYGIRVRERLIVPEGSDVVNILRRHYKRHADVDIEYKRKSTSAHHVTDDITETSFEASNDLEEVRRSIRRKVEDEFARRSKRAVSVDDYESSTTVDRWSHSKYTPAYRRAREETDYVTTSTIGQRGRRGRETTEVLEEDWLTTRRGRGKKSIEVTSDDEYDVRRAHGLAARHKSLTSAPTFTSRLKDKWIFEGETLRTSCTVNSLPEAQVTWYKDGRPLLEGGRIRTTVCVLTTNITQIFILCMQLEGD